MYGILLVDDEKSALRYFASIIQKHLPDYYVAATLQSGEDALAYLTSHAVDLLITDINMPGMDGIELAKRARRALPSIRILIISGYGEFEYARGAIEANVDEYLLKPVSVTRMVDCLNGISEKLAAHYRETREGLLASLLGGVVCDQAELTRYFGAKPYSFALAHMGNLAGSRFQRVRAVSITSEDTAPILSAKGRDDEVIFMSDFEMSQQEFLAILKERLEFLGKESRVTMIFGYKHGAISRLPDFLRRAAQMLDKRLVIGQSQLLPLSEQTAQTAARIPSATLKKLSLFAESKNTRMIKELFASLAVEWEQKRTPQYAVENMVRQIVHAALDASAAMNDQQDRLADEVAELFQYANSCGDMLGALYSMLFEENALADKRTTADELFQNAMRYIEDNYAKQLSIQGLCADLGISQTYLSRLMRKYAGTTFSAYLTKCRMDAAMELIQKHPDILLRDVAACVGYEDQSYFSKIFHQTTGTTPKQYAAEVSQDTAAVPQRP